MSAIDFNVPSQSDTSQMDIHSMGSDDQTKIAQMRIIQSLIGGIYNVRTANVVLTCDVIVADGVNSIMIPAHKSILAAGSTVFYQNFYIALPDCNEFHISNATGDMICKFLTSFYAKSMQLHRDDLPELMQLASDFDGQKCKEICHRFMSESLGTGVDDVLWILEIALRHNCQAICVQCIEKIHQHGAFLIHTNEFLECNRQVFQIVVGNDFVGRNEKRLFVACIEWAKRRMDSYKSMCYQEIRQEIGQCFELIHFNLMDAGAFVECLSEFAPIFGSNEIGEISKAISIQHRGFQSRVDLKLTEEMETNAPRGRLHSMKHIFTGRLVDFRKLYNDKKSADMCFRFQSDAVRIVAHKCILATRSSIFQQRLFEINGPVNVQVTTTTPRIFSAFLKLLYGYEINEVVKKENLDAVLTLASDYRVLDIVKGQGIQLKEFASMQTLFWMVNLCNKYPFIDPMNFNCKWIEKYAHKFDLNLAFHPMALVDCSRSTVQSVLEINYPNQNVMCILEAVMNWAMNRCQKSNENSTITIMNLRKKLKGVRIPFHKMTRSQFDVCQNRFPGLLDEMEIQAILQKMTKSQAVASTSH